MSEARLLRRVVLRNYKSIAAANVEMGPLTLVAGPNGAGKSNFLDALRFVADALGTSLDRAFRDRGGIQEVRRRSGGHPTHFGIRLEFTASHGAAGHYAFRIAARPQGGYEVQREECHAGGTEPAGFVVESGQVRVVNGPSVAAPSDRLYLASAAAREFAPVCDALARMRFYHPDPHVIRELQWPDSGDRLARDGCNATSVLRAMLQSAPARKVRVEKLLAAVAPGVEAVDVRTLGAREVLVFQQQVGNARDAWHFPAASMSDGTLRALGILLALFHTCGEERQAAALIAIEEPELALHPAGAGVLLDAIREASTTAQMLITSHSPDLLDNLRMPCETLLEVRAVEGETQIAAADETRRGQVRDLLCGRGEPSRLPRMESAAALFGETVQQMNVFEEPEQQDA